MSPLYLDPSDAAARRALVRPGAPFAALATSLAADLAPVLARPVRIPETKARLTRAGGTCPRDGARLLFDPFAPDAHQCPTCGAVYTRREDHEWWVMGYQLWLAERSVHAAALALLTDDAASATFAADVLEIQADAYLRYPNADNVLGPTRPFFSTYLESLWLIHVCTALDLLESAGRVPEALGGTVRARIVEPSAALIAGYPEGRSNRQVWNGVARLAAARVLGDTTAAEAAVHGADGIAARLQDALLADGSWYEGDNYHQFAHRGFWYAFRLAERAGIEIAPALGAKFRAGYAVPFRVALPDETLPARRDAQYAVSLRQWRWAEWCELGLTDGAGPRLGAPLARLYAATDPALPHRTGRWRATGESERNEPPSALSRADLGWKSLLFADPVLPPPEPDAAPRSTLLPEQGFAILRRGGGRVYAALDYGGGGGGHGHPDRLNVVLQDGLTRWLDDPGTGTYVERALHWYRSTLAHAAPLVDGRSQERGDGTLLGFDPGEDDGEFAGVAARAQVSLPARVLTSRALVASEAYVVDLFTWRAAPGPCTIDLPFHVDGEVVDARGAAGLHWTPVDAGGAGGLEDGFDFVRDAEAATLAGVEVVRVALRPPAHGNTPNGSTAALWLVAPNATLWRAIAPGPPGTAERRFHAVRMLGRTGRVVAVWDFRGTVVGVARDEAGDVVVTRGDGVDRHVAPGQLQLDRPSPPDGWSPPPPGIDHRHEDRWHVRRTRPGGHDRTQQLALVQPRRAWVHPPPQVYFPFVPVESLPPDGSPLRLELGEVHYLQSEPSWREAGAPTATVVIRAADGVLTIDVDVRLNRPSWFAPPGAANPLDNERVDVNSDGVQLLVRSPRVTTPATWLLVPEIPAPTVRVTRTSADAGAPALDARCEPRPDGWRLTCQLPLDTLGGPGDVIHLDLAVNEKPPDRERRRGQLQLSAARWAGDPVPAFVYLRGDRMDASRALPFQLPGARVRHRTAPAVP